ncbi:glycosyltransferase [Halomonas aestuarii]|uniref:glycosyltransferase n=1 Tax=Halomonas aestuarii TaxID=1897729 RepID=UPI000903A265|nr:glycosyltransferase [Halomonas aestuarii]
MSIIISLTSTLARLPLLRFTLLSIFDQDSSADRIVLCLSSDPYLIDEGVRELPHWLSAMAAQGMVEIMWVENTGPYRKLIPVFRSASSHDWIITCDDDVIYDKGWLSSLVKTGKDHPDAIVCGRARRSVENFFGRRQSYLNWPLVPMGTSGTELLPIGVAGVLYRKPLMDHRIMLSDDYKKLAPKQDDLWFNLARQLSGREVVVSLEADNYVYPIEAPGALSKTNVGTNLCGWDRFFLALCGRLLLKFKAYMGVSLCDNDLVIKKLEHYKRSMMTS